MKESPITEDEHGRLARAHANALLGAVKDPDLSQEINLRLLKEFQATWQPRLSDKEYTALYRTYTDWVLADVRSISGSGPTNRIQMISPESIPDGTEIHRPNRDPMLTTKWLALVRKTNNFAEDAARKIANTTTSGGDGAKEFESQLDQFLRFLSLDPPNEAETDEIIKIFHDQIHAALARKVAEQKENSPPVESSGCLGVVALLALTPLALILSWTYA